MSSEVMDCFVRIRGFMFERVYTNPIAKGQEGKAQEMVGILYQYYLEHFDLLPDYLKALRDRGERIESLVCDYVSSMTDRFAVARFEEIFVPKSWQVI